MKLSSFVRVHRWNYVFRLCLCLVVCCVLAMGGTALITKPAQATCGINLFPDATEGQYYSTLVTSTSTGAGFTCKVMAFDSVYTPPLPFPWSFDPGTAKFSCNPPIGSAGQYTICFQCQEYDASVACYPSGYCGGPCWPAGHTQCQKCTTLTVLPATPSDGGHDIIIITPPPTPTPTVTTFNYTVGIGLGSTSTRVPVTVNGSDAASLLSGETKTIQGTKGNNYNVNVPSTIEGNSGTRYVIKGSTAKTVNYENPSAIFDYAAEYYVEFKTDPKNVAQLQGSNWYAGGTQISSVAPESVKSESENLEYVFVHWNLPDGGTSLSKDLALTVNNAGSYIAVYNSHPIAVAKTNSIPWWIIILVIVIVAAGIVIAILARRPVSQSAKKRK